MTRPLGLLAALLWVAGLVALLLAYGGLTPGVSDYFQNDTGFVDRSSSVDLVAVGTGLIGIAGVAAAGAVLARRRR